MKSGRIPWLELTAFHLNVMLNVHMKPEKMSKLNFLFSLLKCGERLHVGQFLRAALAPSVSPQSLKKDDDGDDDNDDNVKLR